MNAINNNGRDFSGQKSKLATHYTPRFRKKLDPSSYLCFESYELHENFQRYIGDVAVVKRE